MELFAKLGCTNIIVVTHWLPYHQDGTVDDELTSTVKNQCTYLW